MNDISPWWVKIQETRQDLRHAFVYCINYCTNCFFDLVIPVCPGKWWSQMQSKEVVSDQRGCLYSACLIGVLILWYCRSIGWSRQYHHVVNNYPEWLIKQIRERCINPLCIAAWWTWFGGLFKFTTLLTISPFGEHLHTHHRLFLMFI